VEEKQNMHNNIIKTLDSVEMIIDYAGSTSHSEQSRASTSSDSTGSWFTPSMDDNALESDLEYDLYKMSIMRRSVRSHEEVEEYITKSQSSMLIQSCTLLFKSAIRSVRKGGVISRPGCHQIE
jgi:hypothetical protein